MNIKLIIKGIIIGIAKIIPGLSGAVLMISFNLYDKAINTITNFFNNKKENIIFILNLGIGILLGIVLFSNIINYFITNYYLYTTSLFIGLIIGGIPIIKKNTKKTRINIIIYYVSLSIMTIISISNISTTYKITNSYLDTIIYFISGLLEAIGTIIPGISSTALLMLIGIYKIYINILSNILNINNIQSTLSFIIPFTLGLLLGCITISILINYLFKNHKEKTYSAILGISTSTILLLIIKIFPFIHSTTNIIISLLLIITGYLTTRKI